MRNDDLEIRRAGYSCHSQKTYLEQKGIYVGHATRCWQLFLTGLLIEINVKFHKNCDYMGKILKISRGRCYFVKFDIHFFP